MAVDEARAREAVRELLAACGLDPDSPQFARTPARVAAAAGELFSGVGADAVTPLVEGRISLEEPSEASESAAVEAGSGAGDDAVADASQAVLLRNIRFRSMCEHHLLPFDGWVQLAYLPGDSIIGFGRLYDLVETLSSRPTLQEKLGDDLVDAVMTGLDAVRSTTPTRGPRCCASSRSAPPTAASRGPHPRNRCRAHPSARQ
jgi:GTP cyclohydrolase I